MQSKTEAEAKVEREPGIKEKSGDLLTFCQICAAPRLVICDSFHLAPVRPFLGKSGVPLACDAACRVCSLITIADKLPVFEDAGGRRWCLHRYDCRGQSGAMWVD